MNTNLDRLRNFTHRHTEIQYKTDYMYQWLLPMLSPSTIIYVVIGQLTGCVITWFQDNIGLNFMDGVSVSNLALVLSVLMGLQLTNLSSLYNQMQLLLAMLYQTNSDAEAPELRMLVKDFLLEGSTPCTNRKFKELFASIKDDITPVDQKYNAYTTLHANVRATHNSGLNTIIWWMTAIFCFFCVPSQLNDVNDSTDFAWVISSSIVSIIFWSVYSTMKLYEDILRPMHIWFWEGLRPSQNLLKPPFLHRVFHLDGEAENT